MGCFRRFEWHRVEVPAAAVAVQGLLEEDDQQGATAPTRVSFGYHLLWQALVLARSEPSRSFGGAEGIQTRLGAHLRRGQRIPNSKGFVVLQGLPSWHCAIPHALQVFLHGRLPSGFATHLWQESRDDRDCSDGHGPQGCERHPHRRRAGQWVGLPKSHVPRRQSGGSRPSFCAPRVPTLVLKRQGGTGRGNWQVELAGEGWQAETVCAGKSS